MTSQPAQIIRQCGNCTFFRVNPLEADRGRCHFYAPSPRDATPSRRAEWPVVWAVDWCGNWVQADD